MNQLERTWGFFTRWKRVQNDRVLAFSSLNTNCTATLGAALGTVVGEMAMLRQLRAFNPRTIQWMYERYTKNARQTMFFAREEASKVGSPYIEPEHLLLGIMRSGEPELNGVLKLKELEEIFRADMATAQREAPSPSVDIPLSNQNKRVLAYAAEEALRLNSPGIDSRHLLLGILREPANMAGRFLLSKNLDLEKARQVIALLPSVHVGDVGRFARSQIGWASSLRRRFWMGAAVQLALFILLAVGVTKSAIAGRQLLVIAAIWFLAVVASLVLGRRSFGFFWTSGNRSRVVAVSVTYTVLCLYQLLIFGWLVPLGVGIYRVALR